jgi:predicted transcriptional regulator
MTENLKLKILVLETIKKNQNPSTNFFNLIKDKIGNSEYLEIYNNFSKESIIDSYSGWKITELGENRLIEFKNELKTITDEIEYNKKIKETEFSLAESNIKANELNRENSKWNKWFSIGNIIIGLLNVVILIWQAMKG